MRREFLPSPPREIQTGTPEEAVTRAVAMLRDSALPHVAQLGEDMGQGDRACEVGGAGVLRDLDGVPQLVVFLRVSLPTAAVMAEAARMTGGRRGHEAG